MAGALGDVIRTILWLLGPFVKFAFRLLMILIALVLPFKWFNPPVTMPIALEYQRLGFAYFEWHDLADLPDAVPLALVASLDPDFCASSGFALAALGEMGDGGGASALSQRVVVQLYLWKPENTARRVLQIGVAPLLEGLWSKRRIAEMLANTTEFGEGVFGVESAARYFYGKSAKTMNMGEASRLAITMRDPLALHPNRLPQNLRREAARLAVQAGTLRTTGAAACFL